MRMSGGWEIASTRGVADRRDRFSYSKEQCIRAARASLRMMSDSDGTASFLEKWWWVYVTSTKSMLIPHRIPLFYGIILSLMMRVSRLTVGIVAVSGLVVIIDLLVS
jgi:hypothetical protein